MNLFEFNSRVKSGDQLVLFNNYVVDLSSFVREHPGGPFLIKRVIGKDVG